MYNITHAAPAHLAGVKALWELCFPGEAAFADYFFRRLYEPKNALLAVDEQDSPCAMVHLMPHKMVWCGQTVDVSYIYGVGTHPAHRRQGLSRGLMEQALFELHLRGAVFALLIPQEPWLFDFYRAMGFASVFSLPRFADAADKSPASPEDISRLSALYEKHMAERPHLLRNKAHWEQIFEECALSGGGVFFTGEDGYLVLAGKDTVTERLGATPLPPETPFGCARVVTAARAVSIWEAFHKTQLA